MQLEIDSENLTIMGIRFENMKDFRAVWHALSTNMIEGWEPDINDVLRLKKKVEALRKETYALSIETGGSIENSETLQAISDSECILADIDHRYYTDVHDFMDALNQAAEDVEAGV